MLQCLLLFANSHPAVLLHSLDRTLRMDRARPHVFVHKWMPVSTLVPTGSVSIKPRRERVTYSRLHSECREDHLHCIHLQHSIFEGDLMSLGLNDYQGISKTALSCFLRWVCSRSGSRVISFRLNFLPQIGGYLPEDFHLAFTQLAPEVEVHFDDCDALLFPLYRYNHFGIIIAYCTGERRGTCYLFDSSYTIPSSGKFHSNMFFENLSTAMDFMEAINIRLKHEGKGASWPQNWTYHLPIDTYQQTDDYNCGVHVALRALDTVFKKNTSDEPKLEEARIVMMYAVAGDMDVANVS